MNKFTLLMIYFCGQLVALTEAVICCQKQDECWRLHNILSVDCTETYTYNSKHQTCDMCRI